MTYINSVDPSVTKEERPEFIDPRQAAPPKLAQKLDSIGQMKDVDILVGLALISAGGIRLGHIIVTAEQQSKG